jgi:hypothetical protein
MRTRTDWVVGIEQLKPYEFIQLEVFSEEDDAINFAESYMATRGIRLKRRTWRFTDNGNYVTNLVVRKKTT